MTGAQAAAQAGCSSDDWNGCWLVVCSRPAGESVADRFLRMMGGTTYLPMFLRRRCHARRVDEVPTPLFPRYVLLADNGAVPIREVRSAFGVSQIMQFGDGLATVPGDVVGELRSREVDGYVRMDEVLQAELGYKRGDRVRVCGGAMTGFLGKFEKMRGPDRAAVLISLFGRRTVTTVPLVDLERA